jgi:hypothetical protein
MADGFDITDIGGNSHGQNSGMFSNPVEIRQPQEPQAPRQQSGATIQKSDIDITLEKPVVPPNKQALAEEQGVDTNDLWNPVSEARRGGQFKAGEVDRAQEKLLEQTDWDTSETVDKVLKNGRKI